MITHHDRVYGESFIGEKFVSHIWDSGHFAKDALRAKDGRELEVLHHGQWNDDAGADFCNAEVRIDGQVWKGDVEVHVRGSLWRVHHHDVDPRYNSTILHVVMWDDGISLLTRKQNGERIPILILYDYLDSSIGKLWKKIEESEEKPEPCPGNAEEMTLEAIGKVLDQAGMDRFLRRAKVLAGYLEESDENQLLYEGIMEALGYSKNKKQFVELARRTPLEILVGQSPETIQAILFGVAGLIPFQSENRPGFDSETENYISRIEEIWKPISSQFRNKRMFREQWEFFRIRPENFPTRRIAGMSYILSNCGNTSMSLLAMFLPFFNSGGLHKSREASRKLQDVLMPRATGYWTRHYTFGGKQHKESPLLIGQSRSADIVINVVLPVILAHARKLRDQELQQELTEVYANQGKLQDNKVTRYVAGRIFPSNEKNSSVVKSAMRQQGLIHIYKSFCVERNCGNCPMVVVGNPN